MAGEKILILANGEWSAPDRLQALLDDADFVIAADGGWARAVEHGVPVDEVVGDLDSMAASDRDALLAAATPVVHAYSREKDATDLDLAIDHALRRKPAQITLYGALGARIDHAIANLHLLEKGIAARVPILLANGRETAQYVADEIEFVDARPGDRVSLIPISEEAKASTEGLRYPLDGERLLRAASRGVSNVVVSLPARVRVGKGVLLVVHETLEVPADA